MGFFNCGFAASWEMRSIDESTSEILKEIRVASKYYVVWVGRETGVFTSWPYAKKLVDQFPRAKYKSFKTRQEAETAFAAGPAKSIGAAAGKSRVPKSTGMKTHTHNPTTDKRYQVDIYCDGGCDPNPGEAGSGVAVYRDGQLAELWYGLYNPQGTNNTAELNALNQALHIAKESIDEGKTVRILCDSQYSINCITNWAYNWKSKGWKRKVEGDIKNLELIQQAHALYDAMKDDVLVAHVKAHIGIEGNELADRMSIYAVDQKCMDFRKYSEPLDIEALLALRTG